MHDDDKPRRSEFAAVQPGKVDTEALEALFDEHPWIYNDPGSRQLAMNVSRNRINLRPPHEGGSGMMIKLERSPGDADAVYLSVINGETIADVLDGCEFVVLSDSRASTFEAEIDPADTAKGLVVAEPSKLIRLLESCEHCDIEMPVRGNGSILFQFTTHSLWWPPV